MLPTLRFLKDMKAGSGFFKMLMGQVMTEVPSEIVTTAWQNMNNWVNLHPDKSFGDYLDELGPAEAQTVISTLTTTILTAGLGRTTQSIVNRIKGSAEQQQQTENFQKMLGKFNELVAASKVMGRDVSTVEHYVDSLTDGGPIDAVYVDGQAFMQSGVADDAATISPTVAAQMEEVRAGADLRIPLSEFSGRLIMASSISAATSVMRSTVGMTLSTRASMMACTRKSAPRCMGTALSSTISRTAAML